MTQNTTASRGERFFGLDKLKVLCAFLVVSIHAPFVGSFGDYFTALARIAVPVFFMITGFFYVPNKAKKQIVKIFKLTVSANVMYFVWKLALSAVKNELADFFRDVFSVKNIVAFVLVNNNPVSAHLWYLGAILYVLVAVTLLSKLKPSSWKKMLCFATPVLLLADLLFGKYSLAVFGWEIPYALVRNWIFVGIPYFTIGMWLKDKLPTIRTLLKNNGRVKCSLAVFAFAVTTCVERFLLVKFNVNAVRDHYLSTTFLAVAVFVFFLQYVNGKETFVSKIGKYDSTWIYVFHPMFITVFDVAVEAFGLHALIVLQPLLLFFVTTVAVKMLFWLKDIAVNKLNRNLNKS